MTPFTMAQIQRLYNNSPEARTNCKSFAAFVRVVRLVEAAHGIPYPLTGAKQ